MVPIYGVKSKIKIRGQFWLLQTVIGLEILWKNKQINVAIAGISITDYKQWNSNAALPIVYLFFIIYLKSKVWTITRLKNLSGVYGEQYWCKIGNFQTESNVIMLHKHPPTNTKLISQYRITYTLYSGLNHVNYLNIIKRDHVSATVRTRLHLASGWSLDHSGA